MRHCGEQFSHSQGFGDRFAQRVNRIAITSNAVANFAAPASTGEWSLALVPDYAGRPLPEPGVPAGYASIIRHFALQTPLPPRMTALAARHHPRSTPDWLMLTPRHRPEASLAGHLAFAFKWEGIDLGVLAALFRTTSSDRIADIVRATPTGATPRDEPASKTNCWPLN